VEFVLFFTHAAFFMVRWIYPPKNALERRSDGSGTALYPFKAATDSSEKWDPLLGPLL
jgi:hypothetical protein